MTARPGHPPECMDAVDHAGHVLLVIDISGLWVEDLPGRQETPQVAMALRQSPGVKEWGTKMKPPCHTSSTPPKYCHKAKASMSLGQRKQRGDVTEGSPTWLMASRQRLMLSVCRK